MSVNSLWCFMGVTCGVYIRVSSLTGWPCALGASAVMVHPCVPMGRTQQTFSISESIERRVISWPTARHFVRFPWCLDCTTSHAELQRRVGGDYDDRRSKQCSLQYLCGPCVLPANESFYTLFTWSSLQYGPTNNQQHGARFTKNRKFLLSLS